MRTHSVSRLQPSVIAVAVYGLARFLAVLPGGQFADRWGRRPVLAIGGIISAVGSFWCAGAHSFVEFNLARIVAGAGAGIILTIGQIVLADISSPDRRGRNIATYQAAFLFGFGIGPFPGWIARRRLRPGRAISGDGRGECSDDGDCVVSGQRDPVHQNERDSFRQSRRNPLRPADAASVVASRLSAGQPDFADERGRAHGRAVCADPAACDSHAGPFGRRDRLRDDGVRRLRLCRRLSGRRARRPRRPQGGHCPVNRADGIVDGAVLLCAFVRVVYRGFRRLECFNLHQQFRAGSLRRRFSASRNERCRR